MSMDIQKIAIYNQGYLKINGVEIKELQKLKIYIKNIDGKNKGFVHIKSLIYDLNLEKIILDSISKSTGFVKFECKYFDCDKVIKIRNLSPAENKEIDIFDLDCETSKVVSHEFYFTFDINNLVIE